jgi:hypothetical protein
VIGILYGALVALMQKDIKSLVAYSSVAHLGYVMLGVIAMNAQGVSGSVLQMVNHGLSTGALFLMVGLLYERRHTRMLDDFGGLWASVPVYTGLFLVVAMSSAGLPGLNGFVGEFPIMLGIYQYMPIFADSGRRRRDSRRLVPAHRLPQDGAGHNHQPGQRQRSPERPEPQGTGHDRAAGGALLCDRPFPNLFFDKINPSVEAMLETRAALISRRRRNRRRRLNSPKSW